jgi:hypothetical protein
MRTQREIASVSAISRSREIASITLLSVPLSFVTPLDLLRTRVLSLVQGP